MGEKDPGYRFYLNEILELFPSVKIVFIVRNPYDTILSYKFHNLKPYNYNPVFHPIMTSILLKNATMQSMEWENLHPDQILTIRFEELINDKQNSIKEVCSFLNIKINDNNPVIKGTNSSFNNIEKPKLTNIEKYYITKICKKVFENYNYNYQIVKISIFDKIKTIIELIPYSINSYRIMSTIHGNIFNFFRLRMKNK